MSKSRKFSVLVARAGGVNRGDGGGGQEEPRRRPLVSDAFVARVEEEIAKLCYAEGMRREQVARLTSGVTVH